MLPLAAPWPLIVVANLGLRHGWARSLTFVVVVALAAATVLLGLLQIAEATARLTPQPAASIRGGAGFVVTGLVAGAALTPRVRAAVARALPFDGDNPVHALALSGSILLAGFFLSTQISTDVLAQETSGAPIGVPDLISQEVPFLGAALLGVGLLVRRSPAASLGRLGIVRPRWWQVVLALAAAGILFAVGTGIDYLGTAIDPKLMKEVSRASQQVFGGLNNPLGVVALAAAPAVCEEALFRGALQPRLGIVWVAIVFATFHMQYGLSFDSLAVFVLACGLGLVRKFTNTTASMITHALYNGLVGVGLAAAWLPVAVAIEIILLVTLLAAWLLARRRRQGVPSAPL
ncbi:MAG: lysostaphin resistance A-like protein [Candidatus Dormibacteraceae bacterium]